MLRTSSLILSRHLHRCNIFEGQFCCPSFCCCWHSHECPDCAAHRRMRNTRGGWVTSCAVSSPSSDSTRLPCRRQRRSSARGRRFAWCSVIRFIPPTMQAPHRRGRRLRRPVKQWSGLFMLTALQSESFFERESGVKPRKEGELERDENLRRLTLVVVPLVFTRTAMRCT